MKTVQNFEVISNK